VKAVAEEDSEDIGGDLGEAGAVGGGVAKAGVVSFDLDGVDLRRGGVLADDIASAEKGILAGLRFLRAGDGADAVLREKIAEAARSANERGAAAAETRVQIAERAFLGEIGGVEGAVGLVELCGAETVAELEPRDPMAVSVHVDEEREAVPRDGGGEGGVDEVVKLAPGALAGWIAGGGFVDFAVGVEFAAVEKTDDEVRPVTSAREKFGGDGAGEFLSVEVDGAAGGRRWSVFGVVGGEGTIGKRVGAQGAAVWRGDHDRQIAGIVFDPAFGAETDIVGLEIGGRSAGRDEGKGEGDGAETGVQAEPMLREDRVGGNV
jgi:hypothetical protein